MPHLLFVLFLVKELGDLDLDIAEIALAGDSFPFLLFGIGRLFCAWRAALEAAVPVVRNEALALVSLGGAVRVDVVDVRKVGLELVLGQGDCVVDVEQALPPLVQMRGVWNELEAFELAMVGEWGAVAGAAVAALERRAVWLGRLLDGLLLDLQRSLGNARRVVDGRVDVMRGAGQRGSGQVEGRAGCMRLRLRVRVLELLVGLRRECLRRQAMVLVVDGVGRQLRLLQQLQRGVLRGCAQGILPLLLVERGAVGVETLQVLRVQRQARRMVQRPVRRLLQHICREAPRLHRPTLVQLVL